jgi:site-specific DNA recombinase
MLRPDREVTVIPALESNLLKERKNRQLRVASYSRVSTDFEEQLTSFYAQKTYYTDLILRTPEWTLAGTYADEGLSGASAEKRPNFMRMIHHCKQGKIDLIITKSISRFARNTLDSISYVRKLKAMNIGVMFEKENINTLEENSEVILTILASLAQEDLNSLSGNVKMGKRMAMKEGKVLFPYDKIYAYRKGADDQPEIILEEAEIVKRVYQSYLAGASVGIIAEALNVDGVPSPSKKGEWSAASLRGILQNERYCGDVILQKTYVTDPISKKVKKNNGELPKVYIKNNHAPIVSREIYDRVQQERARRNSMRKTSKNAVTEQGKYSSLYALSEILICGDCLTPYRRVIWTKRDGERQVVWRCGNRLDYGTRYCKGSATLDEESLHAAIVEAIVVTRRSRQEMLPYFMAHVERTLREEKNNYLNVAEMEKRIDELKAATMELVAESSESGTVSDNVDRLKAMSDEIKVLHDRLTQYREACAAEKSVDLKIAEMTSTLEAEPEETIAYNDTLVRQLIDTIKVISPDKLLLTFKNGLEYEQSIQPKVRKINRVA